MSNNAWNLSDAKAKFSEFVKKAKDAPQKLYVSGELAGVLISNDDFQKLEDLKRRELRELLEDFVKAAEEEGITEMDFKDLRGPIKPSVID